METDPPQNPLQRLDRAPLSQRLSQLTGSQVGAPRDMANAVARLQPTPPPPAWRGVVLALIDTSSSMAGEPLAQAKRGFIDFAKEAIGSRYDVGLIAFGSDAAELREPTREMKHLERAAHALAAEGGTEMAGAITLAAARLARGSHERIIFLVTDGAPNNREATLAAADAAKKLGIDIMTLGTEGADHDFLRKLASRDKLARNVSTANLQIGMAATARLLLDR